ncbi:MAG: type II toxin-antitoxin system RelE/ParE family toxin [Sphingomonadaceae bacterium]
MTLKIWWSHNARNELDEIDVYFADKNPDYADRIGDAILHATRLLSEHSEAGPAVAPTGTRKWVVVGTPYILLYRPDGPLLRVLHVVHAKRDWTRFL